MTIRAWLFQPSRAARRIGVLAAFTLIELLVVISIVTVLIAVLAPSLGRAREQTKIVVCLSNLHQLGTAIEAYVSSEGTYPLFLLRGEGGGGWGLCSWAWGGKSTAQEPWRGEFGGIFYIPARDRPVNLPAGYRRFGEPADLANDADRSELPLYRCPSDTTTYQAKWGSSEITGSPSYQDVGTSYHINWHWFKQARLLTFEPRTEFDGEHRMAWGRELFKRRAGRGAARFVLLMEEPFDQSIAFRMQTMGFHKRMATHNVLMLDGHAQKLRVRTRDLDRLPFPGGVNWTAFDETPGAPGNTTSPAPRDR